METQSQEPTQDTEATAPQMSELMKAHLDEVAGGLSSHSSWYATA